jgi:hypothetical protein
MLVNPGSIMGNKEDAQFVVYDTSTQVLSTHIID